MYTWQWGVVWAYRAAFLQGALVTVWLTVLAILAGTVLGLLLGLLRRSRIALLAWLAAGYIELFRALPVLVLLIWVYYVAPLVLGTHFTPFVSAWIALSANLAAYVAETVRAGVEAIPKGQYEAGLTLGLRPGQTMRLIILPQALRSMLPNLLGLSITQLKNSSLASVIAVNELLHRSNSVISNSYRPLEVYTVVAAIYLALVLPVSWLAGLAQQRLGRVVRHV